MQIAHRTGQPVLEPGSAAPLAGLPYPRYYFDFEGIDLPVPRWAGVRPYEQIPFQWSCHIERAPGVFDHVEFLDLSGNEPSIPCIERMLEAIPPDGTGPILVYYQTYEVGRLRELAERHPQYAAAVNQYLARIVDLHPMVRANYYCPAMLGSFSIKAVLPTIAPDLDYANLPDVQSGDMVEPVYFEMIDPATPAERRELLKAAKPSSATDSLSTANRILGRWWRLPIFCSVRRGRRQRLFHEHGLVIVVVIQ